MPLPEEKVVVEVLRNGRWAQEPWLPQIEAVVGDKVSISIRIAYKLQGKGKCKILPKTITNESNDNKVVPDEQVVPKKTPPKQVKRKSERDPAMLDKKAAEG